MHITCNAFHVKDQADVGALRIAGLIGTVC